MTSTWVPLPSNRRICHCFTLLGPCAAMIGRRVQPYPEITAGQFQDLIGDFREACPLWKGPVNEQILLVSIESDSSRLHAVS